MACILGIITACFGGFMIFLSSIIPYNIKNESDILLILFVGVIFVVIGIFVFLTNRKKLADKIRFIKKGIIVNAEIIGIEQKMNWLYNGRHPYIINCQWTDPETGVTYKYRTGKFIDNPEKYIQGIKSFEVKIDPENPYVYKLNDEMFKDIVNYMK